MIIRLATKVIKLNFKRKSLKSVKNCLGEEETAEQSMALIHVKPKGHFFIDHAEHVTSSNSDPQEKWVVEYVFWHRKNRLQLSSGNRRKIKKKI